MVTTSAVINTTFDGQFGGVSCAGHGVWRSGPARGQPSGSFGSHGKLIKWTGCGMVNGMSESFVEQVERLESMAEDKSETWDLSPNDKDAIRAVLAALTAERQAREQAERRAEAAWERHRSSVEQAEQERDRLREALIDVLRHCPTLDTLNAVDDDAGSGKRPCPLPKTPRIADIRGWYAALSPQDGQP
jgi:hypothetical protein